MKKTMSEYDRYFTSAIFEDDETYYEEFQYSKSYEVETDYNWMGDYQYEKLEISITRRMMKVA